MATLTPSPKMQFFDANGNPLVGGKLYTYSAGTVTPLATYTDSGAGTPNANPIILDSRGEASVWLGTSLYYMELKSSVDALIWTADNVGGVATLSGLAASGGASLIGANDGSSGTIFTTVQGFITKILSSTGSSIVGFIQAGIGAIARSLQNKARDIISVKDFGAVGDGSTDDTAAIQAAIDHIVLLGGGSIYFPNSESYYKCTATLSISTTANSILFYGDGIWNSEVRLVSGAATTLFSNTTGKIYFQDMSISGMPASGNVFRVGDKGIVSSGVVTLINVSLYGFQNLMQWTGGFYHKFTGCDFRYADVCFVGFNANNLSFDKCQVQAFNSFCEVTGGSGPVSFTNGSLEAWTTRLFTSSGGATVQNLNIHNTYIENFPTTAVAAGLTGVNYSAGFGIVGYETISLIGNMISLKGVRRMISNGNTSNITSVGNRFIYETGTTSNCDFVYVFANLKSGIFNDYAAAELAAGNGTFTTSYISGTYSNFLASQVYDPILGTDTSPWKILGNDVGNAAATLTVATSRQRQLWNTPLTADRAVTLSTTGASSGATFEILRTAAATGAFNLNVGTGPLKALTAGQWCEVTYNGSAWILTKFGSL